jgi:hypothetical protein
MLQGVPLLAARSGFNTPIADSNGKYKIYFIAVDGPKKLNSFKMEVIFQETFG